MKKKYYIKPFINIFAVETSCILAASNEKNGILVDPDEDITDPGDIA